MSKLPVALAASAILSALTPSLALAQGAAGQAAVVGNSTSAATTPTDPANSRSNTPPQNPPASGMMRHEQTAQMPENNPPSINSTKKEVQKPDNDAGVEPPGTGPAGTHGQH